MYAWRNNFRKLKKFFARYYFMHSLIFSNFMRKLRFWNTWRGNLKIAVRPSWKRRCKATRYRFWPFPLAICHGSSSGFQIAAVPVIPSKSAIWSYSATSSSSATHSRSSSIAAFDGGVESSRERSSTTHLSMRQQVKKRYWILAHHLKHQQTTVLKNSGSKC